MPEALLTVVVSQGQSRNPEKRKLETDVAEAAAALDGVQVVRVPHLYDLDKDSETYRSLKLLASDLVVISWLYDRASHWILDRNGVRGQPGEVLLKEAGLDEEDEEAMDDASQDSSDGDELAEKRVTDAQPRPARRIFCVDFRASDQQSDYIEEIERIRDSIIHEAPNSLNAASGVGSIPHLQSAGEDEFSVNAAAAPSVNESSNQPNPLATLLERFANPTNDTYVGSPDITSSATDNSQPVSTLFGESSLLSIDEHPSRRWYPVIDYSRCTNCMECIDFCLFGVYGVDSVDTIMVEQADNCRKGCPACSRVCPQNAIIFPQHKTPAIAGAPVDSGGLKIDLSKLFGAPETDEDPAEVAARERDEQLILAGREAVGMGAGITERLQSKRQQAAHQGSDELDDLLDQLDSLDL